MKRKADETEAEPPIVNISPNQFPYWAGSSLHRAALNVLNGFLSVNFAEEKYTDVALACDGHIMKAHKMILAGCSPYFENLFSLYNIPNLCVAVDNISFPIMQLVMEFMYSGEIRVKHSELENVVRAGVQLRVKGLDAIKISDLVKGSAERTTVIARPADVGTRGSSQSAGPSRVLKTPQKLTRVVNVPEHKLPAIMPKPLNSALEKENDQHTPSKFSPQKSRPELSTQPAEGSSTQKLEAVVKDKQIQPGRGTIEESKEKDGNDELPSEDEESLENRLRAQEPKVSKEKKLPLKNASKEAKLPKAKTRKGRKGRLAKEEIIPRALTRLRASAGSGFKSNNSEASPPVNDANEVPKEPEAETTDQRLSDPPTAEPSETSTSAPDPSTEDREEDDAQEPTRAQSPRTEEGNEGMETDDENIEDSSKEEHSPVQQPMKNAADASEATTKRTRTIKKPARWADSGFDYEPDKTFIKKRRSNVDDLISDQLAMLSEAGKASPKKRKPNSFHVFAQEFRAKLQADTPGESPKETEKRLRLLWHNLDASAKEKYQKEKEPQVAQPKN